MTDETEVEDGEDESYLPQPELVYDESCLILDPLEFAEVYNASAVQMKDGAMFVLDRETHRWRNVEDFAKPDSPKLKRVQ
jgi:hypothetical protein